MLRKSLAKVAKYIVPLKTPVKSNNLSVLAEVKDIKTQPLRIPDEINAHQKRISSWGSILNHCLKKRSPDSRTCDEFYREFDLQQERLKSKEEVYLDTLGKKLDQKIARFNEIFDIENQTKPIEQLPEDFQKLKTEIQLDTTEFLNTKQQLEFFRNQELKRSIVADPIYKDPAPFYLKDSSESYRNDEINKLLQFDLNRSNKRLASIETRLSTNEKAEYVSKQEMWNDWKKLSV